MPQPEGCANAGMIRNRFLKRFRSLTIFFAGRAELPTIQGLRSPAPIASFLTTPRFECLCSCLIFVNTHQEPLPAHRISGDESVIKGKVLGGAETTDRETACMRDSKLGEGRDARSGRIGDFEISITKSQAGV